MEKLPVELLQSICAALCPHCQDPSAVARRSSNQRSLANLSQASSWCRAVAQPFVFHQFLTADMYYIELSWGLRIPTSTSRGALALFMRSLADRPDLAPHVGSLHLVKCHMCPNSLDFDKEPIRTVLDRFASETAMDTGYSNPFLARYAEYDRLVRMAVLRCPNLKSLTLTRWNNFGVFYDLDMGTFPLLTSLSLKGDEEAASFHILDAVKLFAAAPNLEVLYADGCGLRGWPPHNPVRPFDLPLGNLRKLSIRTLEFGDLLMLLPSCPQIQELKYDPPFHPDNTPKPNALQVLRPVQSTLRTLCIQTDPKVSPASPPELVVETPIQSFKNFPALQALTADYSAVNFPASPAARCAGLVDWLPPSIEKVFFRYVPPSHLARFLDLLSALALDAPRSLPRLRSVCITVGIRRQGIWEHLPAFKPALARVRAEFEQAGITFYRADWTLAPAPDEPPTRPGSGPVDMTPTSRSVSDG
jgi:hypothetical protein